MGKNKTKSAQQHGLNPADPDTQTPDESTGMSPDTVTLSPGSGEVIDQDQHPEADTNEAPAADGTEESADAEEIEASANYTLDEKLSKSGDTLPHQAFREAAGKYFPAQCVIHTYAVTERGTVVVFSAGTLGYRKETIGA